MSRTQWHPMKSVAVFCGSSVGRRPEYAAVADTLGALLAARGLGLVYGGARVGLMGVVAAAVLKQGGRVTGVIPGALVRREVAHDGLSDLRVVAGMHERKAEMADLADGFIALPGGLGTLDELFEIATWAQLGIHAKPVGLLNVAGYFDRLLGFLDHQCDERFVSAEHRRMLLVETDPAALLDMMDAYTPPTGGKWLDRTDR